MTPDTEEIETARCLDCSRELTNNITSTGVLFCECNAQYSADLVNASDPELWNQIRTERLFDRVGTMLYIYSPPRKQERYEP